MYIYTYQDPPRQNIFTHNICTQHINLSPAYSTKYNNKMSVYTEKNTIQYSTTRDMMILTEIIRLHNI